MNLILAICLMWLAVILESDAYAAVNPEQQVTTSPESIRKTLPPVQGHPTKIVPSRPIPDQGEKTATAPIVIPQFIWSMEPRFGRDDNGNKTVDLRNTCQYVYNLDESAVCPPTNANGVIEKPRFQVHFDASRSRAIAQGRGALLPIVEYRWLIENANGKSVGPISQRIPQWTSLLEEGPYTVTLTVVPVAKIDSQAPAESMIASTKQQIVVRDILIAAIGDSYVSGEGNPEQVERTTKRHKVDLKPDHDDEIHTVFWADDGLKPPSGSRSTSTVFVKHDKKFAVDEHDIKEHFNSVVGRDHLRSHRSSLAAAPQAALDIERADPHTSVTFISVAASGATIDEGILGPYYGVSNEPVTKYFKKRGEPMPPQIEQLRNLVGRRPIDVLVIGIGGNDIGFSYIAQALYMHPHKKSGQEISIDVPLEDMVLPTGGLPPVPRVNVSQPQFNLEQIGRSVQDGRWRPYDNLEPGLIDTLEVWKQKDAVRWENVLGLAQLPAAYARVSNALKGRDRPLTINNVLIMEYPDFTQRLDSAGRPTTCTDVFSDLTPLNWKISAKELEFARSEVLLPLNAVIQGAAVTYGWISVGGFKEEFVKDGHGICAERPYEPHHYTGYLVDRNIPPVIQRGIRWMRNAKDSAAIQGRDKSKTKGTLHPNEFGHQAMKVALLAEIRKAIPEIK